MSVVRIFDWLGHELFVWTGNLPMAMGFKQLKKKKSCTKKRRAEGSLVQAQQNMKTHVTKLHNAKNQSLLLLEHTDAVVNNGNTLDAVQKLTYGKIRIVHSGCLSCQ